jgi:hypothetical protein
MEKRVVDHFCELREGDGDSVGSHFGWQDDEIFNKLRFLISICWQVVVIYLEDDVPVGASSPLGEEHAGVSQ